MFFHGHFGMRKTHAMNVKLVFLERYNAQVSVSLFSAWLLSSVPTVPG